MVSAPVYIKVTNFLLSSEVTDDDWRIAMMEDLAEQAGLEKDIINIMRIPALMIMQH